MYRLGAPSSQIPKLSASKKTRTIQNQIVDKMNAFLDLDDTKKTNNTNNTNKINNSNLKVSLM